jgi:hypothetical protein
VELPVKEGVYLLEMRGTRAADGVARKTILSIPLYVGVPEERTTPRVLLEAGRAPVSSWLGVVLETYNAERAKAGLTPLALEPTANAHATAQAQRLSERGAKAMTRSETSRALEGVGVALALHSVWTDTAGTAGAFAWTSLSSLRHRRVILSPRMQGIALGMAASGNATRFVEYLLADAPVEEAPPATRPPVGARTDLLPDGPRQRLRAVVHEAGPLVCGGTMSLHGLRRRVQEALSAEGDFEVLVGEGGLMGKMAGLSMTDRIICEPGSGDGGAAVRTIGVMVLAPTSASNDDEEGVAPGVPED